MANGGGMGQFLQNFVMPSVMAVNRLQMAIDAPEKYGVVAVGCELLQWYTSIEDDMEPIPVANHALAGSSTADLLGGISYQVLDHEPRVVIYMCGCNDLYRGESPNRTVNGFMKFVDKLHAHLSDTQIIYVSIINSPLMSESNHDESIEEANHLARKACDNDPRLTYLDINSLFMYSDGTQRKDMFQFFDNHNLTTLAYEEFSRALSHTLKRVWTIAGGDTLEHLSTREQEEEAGGEKEL